MSEKDPDGRILPIRVFFLRFLERKRKNF